jgi:uncharacterized RDD family membrane protein YckC
MKTYNSHETQRMHELNGKELASFLPRLAAFILDIVCASILFLIIGTIIETVGIPGWFNYKKELVLTFYGNWYSVVWFVIYFGLSAFWGNGKTIGKWIMGIRIVSLIHNKLSFWHAMERALGYGASLLEFGFGFIQFFIHPYRRTVHDRISETIVVAENKKKSKTIENIIQE